MTRLIYPLDLLYAGLEMLNTVNHSKIRRHPSRPILIYQLVKMGDFYLPLNRDYKPIGLLGGGRLALPGLESS